MTQKSDPRSSVSLDQAIEQSGALRSLIRAAHESQRCLDAVKPLVATAMHPAMEAGPLDNGSWCIIVANNACAAKLRQMLPGMQAHLQSRGWQITSIRLKIKTP